MKNFAGTENVKFEVKGNKLLLEIDLKYRGQLTPKGNVRVCSTLGNKEVPGTSGVMMGLNIYTKSS